MSTQRNIVAVLAVTACISNAQNQYYGEQPRNFFGDSYEHYPSYDHHPTMGEIEHGLATYHEYAEPHHYDPESPVYHQYQHPDQHHYANEYPEEGVHETYEWGEKGYAGETYATTSEPHYTPLQDTYTEIGETEHMYDPHHAPAQHYESFHPEQVSPVHHEEWYTPSEEHLDTHTTVGHDRLHMDFNDPSKAKAEAKKESPKEESPSQQKDGMFDYGEYHHYPSDHHAYNDHHDLHCEPGTVAVGNRCVPAQSIVGEDHQVGGHHFRMATGMHVDGVEDNEGGDHWPAKEAPPAPKSTYKWTSGKEEDHWPKPGTEAPTEPASQPMFDDDSQDEDDYGDKERKSTGGKKSAKSAGSDKRSTGDDDDDQGDDRQGDQRSAKKSSPSTRGGDDDDDDQKSADQKRSSKQYGSYGSSYGDDDDQKSADEKKSSKQYGSYGSSYGDDDEQKSADQKKSSKQYGSYGSSYEKSRDQDDDEPVATRETSDKKSAKSYEKPKMTTPEPTQKDLDDKKAKDEKKAADDKKKEETPEEEEEQEKCPEKFAYTVAKDGREACRMPFSYHAGHGHVDQCEHCEYSYGRWFAPCAENFVRNGCCLCTAVCPDGMPMAHWPTKDDNNDNVCLIAATGDDDETEPLPEPAQDEEESSDDEKKQQKPKPKDEKPKEHQSLGLEPKIPEKEAQNMGPIEMLMMNLLN